MSLECVANNLMLFSAGLVGFLGGGAVFLIWAIFLAVREDVKAKSLIAAANEYHDATMKRLNEVHSMIDKVEDAAND